MMPHLARRLRSLIPLLVLAGAAKLAAAAGAPARPNILFILIDDHAANMTSVRGESPVRTPQIERLAARGSWFTRAYAAVPSCAPSRAAFLTGIAAHKSGVYYNSQSFRRTTAPISKAVTMQRQFLDHGYLVAGYGKINHTGYQEDTLTDYTPGYFKGHGVKKYVRNTDGDLVRHIIPETLRLPDPAYLPTRFGALPDDWDRDDPEKQQQDTEQANRAIAFLREAHAQPFFLSVGFWRPHSERIVPKRYYDLYPLESVVIPPSYKADDLEDVPAPGRRQATHQGTHAAVVNAGLWREYLRSYYAAVSYIDEQVGRVLDALDASPHARNTIVVFTSDNGYNGGEKNMWAKYALWEQTNRVVFGISGPGLPRQTSDTPVSLIDIYPTLLALCGVPPPPSHTLDGIDLTPVLKAKRRDRGQPVLSTFGVGNHSITDGRFRYIRYRNGDEELYDHRTDGYEWTNLARDPKFLDVKTALARLLPATDAPEIEPARPWDGSELNAEVFKRLAAPTLATPQPPPPLRDRALTILKRAFAEERAWIRVHAAEALIALGERALVREAFLRELPQLETGPARIGAWRVLAATAPTPAERATYIAKIEAVFLTDGVPDRLQAIETLAKLEVAISGAALARAQAMARGPESERPFFFWALQHAGQPEALARLRELLQSSEVVARSRAAYALRWLRPRDAALRKQLTTALDTEAADSTARPYLLSAALALDADPTRVAAWQRDAETLLAQGPASAQFEFAQTLPRRLTARDTDKFASLLEGRDADTRIGGAWLALQVLKN